MVKIRLRRVGKIHSPFYQIMVITDRVANKAKFLEKVGFYSPLKEEYELNDERILHWLTKGAQPSRTVRNLLSKNKIMTAFHELKIQQKLNKAKLKQDETKESTIKTQPKTNLKKKN